MYLNDLKTRLLPRAIPNATQTTSNVMANPNCDTYIISQESTGFGQEFHQESKINTNELLYGQMESTESKNSNIQNAIQEAIRRLQNIGLKVLALVTDMGKNYQNMTKRLGLTPKKPYFDIDGEHIHYLADPPHLIKATRNNAYINDIKYNGYQISWDYIVTLYNYDKNQPNRLAYKLTDTHVQSSGAQNVHANVKQDKGKAILIDDHDYREISLPEQNALRYVCG
ncbi:thap domain-containing [Lasius niger]|uniref:Thap domain-containing n=1 Tax=Lasius niger TaxID=67767 RepID=A0A0J7KDH6_LASNI|nr:thap domain-containing [Lasius niger]